MKYTTEELKRLVEVTAGTVPAKVFASLAAEVIVLREREKVLVEACQSALLYDRAIRNRGMMGDVEVLGDGVSVATGDDLDALYDDWITKARAALMTEAEQIEEAKRRG